MEEKIFFENGSVKITNSRFIAEDKTYAMANISSVSIGVLSPNKTPVFVFFIIGLVLLLLEETRIVGIAVAIVAVIWYYLLKKVEYTVRITSNSGQADSYISKDKTEIAKIVFISEFSQELI